MPNEENGKAHVQPPAIECVGYRCKSAIWNVHLHHFDTVKMSMRRTDP